MALWGATAIGIFVGYRPPKRLLVSIICHGCRSLGASIFLGLLCLPFVLALFLTSLNLGGGLYAWTNVRVLVTMIVGLVVLIAFGVYEWKGTKTGILHHNMFRGGKNAGRTFFVCVGLIFVEGVMLFSYIIFYPTLYGSLDPSL